MEHYGDQFQFKLMSPYPDLRPQNKTASLVDYRGSGPVVVHLYTS